VAYGKNTFLGFPSNGTEESIKNLQLSDIENYYKNNISNHDLNIVVVGDIEAAEAEAIMNRFAKLPNQKIELPAVVTPAISNPRTVFFYNIPKAAQTEFRIGAVNNLKYDATGEYYQCGLMNFPFGGAFNCRLNINLREDKGWTYGARGGFNGNDYTGYYVFSSGIKAAVTDSALMEIIKEFDNYNRDGISENELSFMKNAIGQSDARKYETGFQKAGFLGNILRHDLPATYVNQQTKILNGIDKKTIDALIHKWLKLDAMNIVLAGDMEKLKPGLEAMKYRVVEIDADGKVKQ
jgi:zinc protease